jgi:prepilin-type N-terminal cleavage/methylation domain-containing protein
VITVGRANCKRRAANAAGFTLIEIAVVIVVLSLLLAMIAGLGTAMVGSQRREATRQRLAGVETAIALFVSQHKRLPCPANGTLAGTDANAGKESPDPPTGVCTGSQANGVVPWRALGLGEQDVTDGWGNRLTYRAAPDYVVADSMNFTACSPGGTALTPSATLVDGAGVTVVAGGACANTCTTSASYPGSCTPPEYAISGRGLQVKSVNGTSVMTPSRCRAPPLACNHSPPIGYAPSTGAAYVVVSHGENYRGAYNNQGVLQAASGPDWGTEEAKHSAADALATYYVDDFPAYVAGNDHFDDFVLRPSILTVATKAQLGPRAR